MVGGSSPSFALAKYIQVIVILGRNVGAEHFDFDFGGIGVGR